MQSFLRCNRRLSSRVLWALEIERILRISYPPQIVCGPTQCLSEFASVRALRKQHVWQRKRKGKGRPRLWQVHDALLEGRSAVSGWACRPRSAGVPRSGARVPLRGDSGARWQRGAGQQEVAHHPAARAAGGAERRRAQQAAGQRDHRAGRCLAEHPQRASAQEVQEQEQQCVAGLLDVFAPPPRHPIDKSNASVEVRRVDPGFVDLDSCSGDESRRVALLSARSCEKNLALRLASLQHSPGYSFTASRHEAAVAQALRTTQTQLWRHTTRGLFATDLPLLVSPKMFNPRPILLMSKNEPCEYNISYLRPKKAVFAAEPPPYLPRLRGVRLSHARAFAHQLTPICAPNRAAPNGPTDFNAALRGLARSDAALREDGRPGEQDGARSGQERRRCDAVRRRRSQSCERGALHIFGAQFKRSRFRSPVRLLFLSVCTPLSCVCNPSGTDVRRPPLSKTPKAIRDAKSGAAFVITFGAFALFEIWRQNRSNPVCVR
eukprot:scaffold69_cov248-Pinguiococcus_pyrenoidosus.AAC.78